MGSFGARIKRIFRSFVGAFINIAEDPKLILEQNIRDMNDKIPTINLGLAKAKGGIILLQNEMSSLNDSIRKSTSRIKACLAGGDEKTAGEYALNLQRDKDALANDQVMLDKANEGYKILLSQKDAYIVQVKQRTEEARSALKGLEAAKWKADLASAFQSFEVGDVSQTQDEMIDRIKQKTAEGEGKLASAVDGMSSSMRDIENDKRAQQFEAQEILNQFKLDNPEFAAKLPAASTAVAAEPERTMGAAAKVAG